jgi:cytochrome P450
MSTDDIPYGVPADMASRSAQIDPYPYFERMRNSTPVRYDEQRDAYDLFRYENIERVVSDTASFSKADVPRLFEKSLADVRPDEYRVIGDVVEGSFTPKAVADRREELASLADEVLDAALDGSGSIDFVSEIAKPYPIRVIARFLGIPTDQLDTFRDWSLTLTDAPAEMTREAFRRNIEEKKEATTQMSQFFADLIEKREADPADDLVTALLSAEQSSELLTRQHTIDTCNFLLLAGNVTTTSLLTNAVWTFEEENVFEDLRDGTLDLHQAIEEVLRYRSPVMGVQRMTQEPVEIDGVSIDEGTQVSAWISSANRDPEVFDHPDTFDPSRSDLSAAMPFGKGMRFCLGAHLARLEAEIILSKLLDRTERIEVRTGSLEPYLSREIFGTKELHVSVPD